MKVVLALLTTLSLQLWADGLTELEQLLSVSERLKQLYNQSSLTSQQAKQLYQLEQQQTKLWNQLAHSKAKDAQKELLSPTQTQVTHQESCKKIEKESECRKRAIKNALIELASQGGAANIKTSSSIETSRSQNGNKLNSSESFNQSSTLNSHNQVLNYQIQSENLEYNSIINEKVWTISLAGEVSGKLDSEGYQTLFAKFKQELKPLLAANIVNGGKMKKTIVIGDIRFDLILIPKGDFILGTNDGDKVERPASKQHVDAFYIANQEVSTHLYQRCVDDLACNEVSIVSEESEPIRQVSWNQVVNEFLPWINSTSELSFRLPSEIEWEYAAKLNMKTLNDCADAKFSAEYDNCNKLMPVNIGLPGEIGLYHSSGNIAEWTASCWNDRSTQKQNCNQAVVKGGSWYDNWYYRRPSSRFGKAKTQKLDTIGFRLALSLPSKDIN